MICTWMEGLLRARKVVFMLLLAASLAGCGGKQSQVATGIDGSSGAGSLP